ncbi:MAG: phenylalanine--tRNA ligase subunit beta [bacterium]|nr:phenylalanine--tRNA ligase subunit beta [bacterium]
MPTICFELKDMQQMVGRKLTKEQLEELAHYAKGELETFEPSGEVSMSLDDTNLPHLWSVEGLARHFRGVLGIDHGIPKLPTKKADYQVIVDKSVNNVRPYIAAFVAKGHKIDDYLLKQMVQLQEKLCDSYGRKRAKVSIGLYSYKRITFPVHYKATDPESVKFVPLEFKKEMTQQEILEDHPKGREYAHILKGLSKYPILIDEKGEVLSFPPVINSNFTGKVEEGDTELFYEVTGTDNEAILLATNIFAQALSDRGFEIFSVDIKYPTKAITTPFMFNERIKLKPEQVREMIGININQAQLKKLLEKGRFYYKAPVVEIPHYRRDILHLVDVIEDVAIMYGYQNIKDEPLTSYTVGSTYPLLKFANKIRDMAVGLGFQEVMSSILSNKETLFNKMNLEDFGTVEIEQYMSESYSVVRSWLTPMMMEVLSKNKHVDYPQKIFEQGLVTRRKGSKVQDFECISIVSCHNTADYTEAKQIIENMLKQLNLKCDIKETEHSSFIPGRVSRISVNGKDIAYAGEISPKVLENWKVETPAAAVEINLTELFELIK